jgi:hypothetical protein
VAVPKYNIDAMINHKVKIIYNNYFTILLYVH